MNIFMETAGRGGLPGLQFFPEILDVDADIEGNPTELP